MKKSKGIWKKERAVGRKYTKSDSYKMPPAHKRKKFWVGAYQRGKKKVKGYFKENPNYKR